METVTYHSWKASSAQWKTVEPQRIQETLRLFLWRPIRSSMLLCRTSVILARAKFTQCTAQQHTCVMVQQPSGWTTTPSTIFGGPVWMVNLTNGHGRVSTWDRSYNCTLLHKPVMQLQFQP